MKKIIIIIGLITTLPAFADSAKMTISPFKATLNVDRSDLTITDVKVYVSNQFCNFWGTTCAGGPRDTEELPVVLKESADGATIVVKQETEYELGSLKVGNRFSSCNASLEITGQNSKGKVIYGTKRLVFINDKDVCSSKEAIAKVINKELANPILVKSDGFMISVK